MYKLLLISNLFPPFNTAESICSGRTAIELCRIGWDVTVLTISLSSSNDSIDNDLINPILNNRIIRTSSYEKFLLLSNKPVFHKIFYNGAIKLLKLLGIPEIQLLWYPNANKIGNSILRTSNIDIIYSRSQRIVSNITALSLKRKSGLPWIAHFSDPWIDNPYIRFNKLERIFCKHFEKNIVREADQIIFVSKRTADLVMSKYPSEYKTKVHIIPHGYTEENLHKGPTFKFTNNKFHLVYTGDFYFERNPSGIFKALRIINDNPIYKNKIELIIITRHINLYKEEASRMGIEDLVIFYEKQSFNKTRQIASEADTLVLIDAAYPKTNIFLPSKLVDYLILRKPILGITPIDGEPADLLNRLGFPVVDPNDIQGISESIIYLYKANKSNQKIISPDFEDVISHYNITKTTRELDEIFKIYVSKEKPLELLRNNT